MGLTLKDDWKRSLSVLGGPSVPPTSQTSMHLSHVFIWDSGTFVRVQQLR